MEVGIILEVVWKYGISANGCKVKKSDMTIMQGLKLIKSKQVLKQRVVERDGHHSGCVQLGMISTATLHDHGHKLAISMILSLVPTTYIVLWHTSQPQQPLDEHHDMSCFASPQYCSP